MKRIQILAPLVAERIAAGEVVERPASVVKELVENAIDAGATDISVRLEEGGKSLIEVIDNGFGMGRADLELSVLRHATSKIREVSDLERLASLGFRGEALPSIAACADLSILSREPISDTAAEWRNGKVSPVTFGDFLGKPHGTRIQVRALFSQIPARLKFLKSGTSEIAAVREWMERLALTNPQVGFHLETEARTLLTYRPESEPERVARILGDDGDYPVITDEIVEAGAIRARIHWLQGATSPQMRKIVQAVNGRAVRDRLISQALLVPFRQALLPGQFPWLALFLEVPPGLIDVNVHPTKTELRFLNGSQIFRTIERLAERMIGKHGSVGFAVGRPSFETNTPEGVPSSQGPLSRAQPSFFASPTETLDRSLGAYRSSARNDIHDGATSYSLAPLYTPATSTTGGNAASENSTHGDAPTTGHPFTRDRYAGALFQTYLLYDLGSELALIDQHAAHERIRFERLRSRALTRAQDSASQALLIPEAVRIAPEARPVIEARLPLLETLGFEGEIFGDDQLLFRSIPAEWGAGNLRARLLSLVEKLSLLEDDEIPRDEAGRIFKLDERLFEKLASEACHSAVRAGDRLDERAAQTIVEALFRCEHPWNCPHGRPTVARVPRTRFEEWFQRRV